MLFSTRCPVCQRPEGAPCPECFELLEPAPPLAAPAGCDELVAALVYDGVGRLLISRVKYRDARAAVGWLAEAMVAGLPEAHGADLITWAPTTAGRRQQRGFDQSELLARAVARRLRLPVANRLRRHSNTTQTGRSGAERRSLGSVFVAPRSVAGRVVIVVDDVTTTGSTLAAAAGALRAQGAEGVIGLAAGATPAPAPVS